MSRRAAFAAAFGVSAGLHLAALCGLGRFFFSGQKPLASPAELALTSVEVTFAGVGTSSPDVPSVSPPPLAAAAPLPPPLPVRLPDEAAAKLSLEEPPAPPSIKPPDPDFPEPLPEPAPVAKQPSPEGEQEKKAERPNPEIERDARAEEASGRVEVQARPFRALKTHYPVGSRRRGEEGDVGVRLRITKRGTVESAEVVKSSGFAELDREARKACLSWRFIPARGKSGTVASETEYTVSFRLTDPVQK